MIATLPLYAGPLRLRGIPCVVSTMQFGQMLPVLRVAREPAPAQGLCAAPRVNHFSNTA